MNSELIQQLKAAGFPCPWGRGSYRQLDGSEECEPGVKANWELTHDYYWELPQWFTDGVPMNLANPLVLPSYVPMRKFRLSALGPRRFIDCPKETRWDGASGWAIDTYTNMRGSLIHDALYWMLRAEVIQNFDDARDRSDRILREICREDGMGAIRAGWTYGAVALGGRKHAHPDKYQHLREVSN